MIKSHLTEADVEDMLRLQAIAARPAEREQRRRQGMSPCLRSALIAHLDSSKECEVDCGDREEIGHLH